uniref:Peptidase S1 domain-containing protein n=1 Tax=Anopheles funestus TaxID=62324 RepID=A0A4Y0BRA1_ANOFN
MARVRCWAISLIPLCLLPLVALSLAQSCGKRVAVNRLVVHGALAKEGYWPWFAALFQKNGGSFNFSCGGTILDKNTVLTAAHCVKTSNRIIEVQNFIVKAGLIQLSVANNNAKEYKAMKIIVHPQYRIGSIKHDAALIKLETDISYSNAIKPICLCDQDEDQSAIIGSWGTVIGFGRDETDNPSDTLRETSIPVVSTITCIESNREVFGNHLTSDMFCAGNRNGSSACNGDSGGGLFFNRDGTWFIRGIVSFTKNREGSYLCDTQEYTVFTDVAKYIKWIKQNMRKTKVSAQPTEAVQSVPVKDKNRKIELLPMSTCGPNKYGRLAESRKPVLFGYPWVALLEYLDETESNEDYDTPPVEVLCQATLISELYLITSASCIYDMPKRYILSSVRLGEYDKDETTDCAVVRSKMVCSPPLQIREIDTVIAHKNYNNQTFANNIALIRLRDPADTSQSNVKPICLPVRNELRNQQSIHYTLTAWTACPCSSLLLRSIREVISLRECKQLFNELQFSTEVTNNQICIKQLPVSSTDCKFPNKGATLQRLLTVEGKSRYVMYGLLSTSPEDCDVDIPDVHVNVANYVNWILENIEE